MCTTAHHYTSKKRRRNNNGVDYRVGIVSSRQIIDDLHALQHNAAEKQPGAKRSRKKHEEMEAEYRATYTAKEECLLKESSTISPSPARGVTGKGGACVARSGTVKVDDVLARRNGLESPFGHPRA